MQRRSTHSTANFGDVRPDAAAKRCDAVGCADDGVYPAPRNRAQPRPYIYFCLEHIRAYNAGWDYYRGMNSIEIEADRRLDVLWRRPTWALGGKNATLASAAFQFEDPLAAFTDIEGERPGSRRFRPSSIEASAQIDMGLDDDFDADDLKVRYIALVKRWHPDANGGSHAAEERLKVINEAYRILKRALGAYS